MAADEQAGDGKPADADDEALDGALVERFAALDAVPVPELWDRVTAGTRTAALPPAGRRFGRASLAMAAGVVALVGVGVAAWVAPNLRSSEPISADGAAPIDTAGDDPATGEPLADDPDSATTGCDISAVVARLRSGLEPISDPSSSSPRALAAETVVLRGQLVSVQTATAPPGTTITVKVRDAIGANDVDDFATGATLALPGIGTGPGPDAGLISGDFVAFVTRRSASDASSAWVVAADGLWVGCGDDAAAEAVLVQPDSPDWRSLIDDGITLGELWDAAVFDDGTRATPLGPALLPGDGTAVFDVTLATGDRFRVSVPEPLGDGLDTVVESAGQREPLRLTGSGGTLTITLALCEGEDAMTPNRLGSSVAIDGAVATFCRGNEMLRSTLEATTPIGDEADTLDVRPIAVGSWYGPALAELWPHLANCDNCAPWGPVVLPDDGVVVNRTGDTQITAVSLDDLVELWTVDTGGGAAALHGRPDGLFVEVTGGAFQRRDPATGEVVWALDRDEGERGAALISDGTGGWLLRSSFGVEGDDRPPLLRSIDLATGRVRWTAEGRAGTEWQWTDPVTIGGVIVLMDVTDAPAVPAEPVGGTLRAYDVDSGELVWTTDLDSPTEAYTHGLLAVLEFETGPALVARSIDGELLRVDPETGAVLWRTEVGLAVVDGTVETVDGRLAIGLDDRRSRLTIDPETGQRLERGN